MMGTVKSSNIKYRKGKGGLQAMEFVVLFCKESIFALDNFGIECYK